VLTLTDHRLGLQRESQIEIEFGWSCFFDD